MRRVLKSSLIICLFLCLLLTSVTAEVRLKDIAKLEGAGTKSVIGYGLVIGLNGTGDRYRSPFTEQSLANMLVRFGITVNPDDIQPRNVAAVMVTAEMHPFVRPGTRFDISVSSIGDASSLAGGTLLPTPLSELDGVVWGSGRGPISVGGFNIQSGRVSARKNYTVVGRVPNGGVAERAGDTLAFDQGTMRFNLNAPDFTTAQRVVEAFNTQFGTDIARAVDASGIEIQVPQDYRNGREIEFIAAAEALTLEIDVPARVIINERTGTVVVGENVRLRPAAITHGSISIAVNSAPIISQPGPFSSGNTVVRPLDQITVNESQTPMVAIPEGTSIGEVAAALNSLGVTPVDLIAIFQALKEAGSLQADLVII